MAAPHFHSGAMVTSTATELLFLPEHVQVAPRSAVPEGSGASSCCTVFRLQIPAPKETARRNRPGYKSSSGAA
jgi:hypothetical protein